MQNKKWNVQSYNENSQLQYQASKNFFDEFLLKGDEIILDIGCGTGLLTSEIAKKVPQGKVIGIDSSESMISFAREHYLQSNLEFVLMRAEDLSFSFTFDIIISSFCVQWIKNKKALFDRIATHLSQNGSIGIIMPFRHEGIAKIRSKLMTEPKWTQYFDIHYAQELLIFENNYKHYAEEAGFDNLNYQTEDVTTYFEDATKLKAFLKNVTSYLDCLPTDNLQNEFMQDVVDLYLQTTPSATDGSCAVTYTYGKIRSRGIKLPRMIEIGRK